MLFLSHEKQKDIFKRALERGRLSHAYIFSGCDGVGKFLFAVNTAKALLCERDSFFSPCSCPSCRQIDAFSHPDVHIYNYKTGDEKDENSKLNIASVKKIAAEAVMTPLLGKWKVYIIDHAEDLANTGQGAPMANALLKTLEEPGENTVFFLITNNYDIIIPTIRSRAIQIKFSPLKEKDIAEILRTLRPSSLLTKIKRAASLSGGSCGRALAYIDSNYNSPLPYLKEGDFVSFAGAVIALKDKEEIKMFLRELMPFILEKYRDNDKYIYCQLGYYLPEILRRLNYNANMDIVKGDIVSKVTEVFNESV